MTGETARPVVIGNCSGFYGDRLSAARDMVTGGDLDVLTGDYLAELTMLILAKARQKDPSAGYATTFLKQMEQVLALCLERGIKVVTNAGGLNPSGLAEQLRRIAAGHGLAANIAYIEGDDLLPRLDELQAAGHPLNHLDQGKPLAAARSAPVTANVYLGAWGIAEALRAGADVVVCPRVTDASLVVGPAAWWHDWQRDDWDRLAGAVVAGHVLECGTQATGGNYAFLEEITDPRYPGFPIAEVAADGSSVITKHPGTAGLVSVGTVTAQLLYEIGGPRYVGPDVVTRFDTIEVTPAGPDRVQVSGVRGEPAPPELKVAINLVGGYRNTMTMVLTGLNIDGKARHAESLLRDLLDPVAYDEIDVQLLRFDHPDSPRNPEASAQLRVTVKGQDPRAVGRAFSDAVISLALASYAGFFTTTPPARETMFGVYWPALVPAEEVIQTVVLADGMRLTIPHSPTRSTVQVTDSAGPEIASAERFSGVATRIAPLGAVAGARSGDKGGNANVGLWARDASGHAWLRREMTEERIRQLLPEAAGLGIRCYDYPNLHAVNVVIEDLLGDGVASSARFDAQAKGLGEFFRSRRLAIPVSLLDPEQAPSE
jgi:hypothetical protein